MSRLISLAAGVCPELGPADFVSVCAEAGWPAAGIWFDTRTWSDQVTAEVALRLSDSGLVPLDVEALFVGSNGDNGDHLIEAAAALGARNVLVVSRGMERPAFVERFAELCDLAAPAGIRCAIEFIPFFDIKTVEAAANIVREVGQPNGAVLADNLHVARGGGSPNDLRSYDDDLFPYAQLCDAAPGKPTDLYREAIDGRMVMGGPGGLPAREFVQALPHNVPLSLEIRSAALRSEFPNHVERAKHVLKTTSQFLSDIDTSERNQ